MDLEKYLSRGYNNVINILVVLKILYNYRDYNIYCSYFFLIAKYQYDFDKNEQNSMFESNIYISSLYSIYNIIEIND